MTYREEIRAKIEEARGHERANLHRTRNAIRQAEEFLDGTGCRYANEDFDVMNALVGALTAPLREPRTEQQKKDYREGYAAGYRGDPLDVPRAQRSESYDRGYDHGDCDRPTLDELLPLDARKEAAAWWT